MDVGVEKIDEGLGNWKKIAQTLGKEAWHNEAMESSVFNTITTWPVALSQIHATYEEVLHSPVPLTLSSPPPHL